VKSTADIQRDMQQTRESITEKVSALENQVLGTIQTAADTVTNTVDAVKDAVTNTPAAVGESVRDCIRRNPWATLGGALFVGALLGRRFGRSAPAISAPQAAVAAPASAAEAKPGLLDDLGEMMGKELRELAEQSLSTLIQSVKRSLGDRVPEVVDAAIHRVTNRIQDVAPHNGRAAMNGV
jgi:ElaB/YqjD/DUF883 family membrane-anchored ribosome-binding protein